VTLSVRALSVMARKPIPSETDLATFKDWMDHEASKLQVVLLERIGSEWVVANAPILYLTSEELAWLNTTCSAKYKWVDNNPE
jgi:hypothetical protein